MNTLHYTAYDKLMDITDRIIPMGKRSDGYWERLARAILFAKLKQCLSVGAEMDNIKIDLSTPDAIRAIKDDSLRDITCPDCPMLANKMLQTIADKYFATPITVHSMGGIG